MALKTVTGKLTGPDGAAIGKALVQAQLSVQAVIASTQEVAAETVSTFTDTTLGTWSLSLQANADLTPSSSYYTFRVGDWIGTAIVPQGAGPYKLEDIMAAAPVPAPVVGYQAGSDAVFRSVTVLPSGPYTPTAATGGGDFSGAVRIGSGKPWFDITHPTFGASTGASDNTAAIQAAITAAATVGGAVFFPVGTFLCGGQITIAATQQVHLIGADRAGAILRYNGVTQQPFVIFPGQNQGSTIEHMTICGYPADPALQILTSTGNGTGTNGYNSEVTIDDCYIGAQIVAAGNAPTATIAYRGAQLQADVMRFITTEFYGRDVGCQIDGGSDFWGLDGGSSCLPQAAEPNQIGFQCTTRFVGNGRLVGWLISAAGASTTGAQLRSVVDLVSCHCESGHLPLSLINGKFSIIGGSYNGDATSTLICSASNATGTFSPTSVSKTAATIGFFSSTSSPAGWRIIMPDTASIVGGLPTTPIACDWLDHLFFPGCFTVPGTYSAFAAPAMSIGLTATANSIATFFVPNDGNKHFYRIAMQVTITTHGTESINAQVVYTDSGGAARTLTIPLTNTAGTVAIAAAAADSFVGTVTIACNPNTSILLKATGTFTGGVVYNVAGQAEQIA